MSLVENQDLEEMEVDDEVVETEEFDSEELEDLAENSDPEKSRFFNKCRDNGVEWYTGDDKVTVTFSQRKWVSKIKKLSVSRPDEVELVVENEDGSIVAHIPLSYVKISPPKKVSEEQKERMRLQAQKNIAEGKFGRKKKVEVEVDTE